MKIAVKPFRSDFGFWASIYGSKHNMGAMVNVFWWLFEFHMSADDLWIPYSETRGGKVYTGHKKNPKYANESAADFLFTTFKMPKNSNKDKK